MARARNIKPATAENEVLAKLTAHTRILWMLLPCHADCEGKLEDRPQRIHIKIFPYEPKLNVDKMLQSLADTNFITRYEADGEKYIWINKFLDHQSPTKKERVKGSTIPDYEPNSHGTVPEPGQNDTSSALTLNPKPLTFNPKPLTPSSEPVIEIAEYYKTNINSDEIASGKRNLVKLLKTESPEDMMECVKNYHTWLKINNKVGTQYTYRMRNFFGRDARFDDYREEPVKGPQNAPVASGESAMDKQLRIFEENTKDE